MYTAFLIKYAEIAIKGKNRYIFEDALVRNIRYQLKTVDGNFTVRKENGRIYVETEGDYDYDETVTALQRVFGIVGICPVLLVEDNGFEALCEDVIKHIDEAYPNKNFTFSLCGSGRAFVIKLKRCSSCHLSTLFTLSSQK